MKKSACMVALFVCFMVFSTSLFAEIDLYGDKQLGVSIDLTVADKYLWRGFDVFDGQASFQPSVTLDLFESGFWINYWAAYSLSSGFESLDEHNYVIGYDHTFFDGESYVLDVSTNYIYYDFPNTDSQAADTEEIGVSFTFPELLPIGLIHLVPSYYGAYFWPANSGGPDKGWWHNWRLSYDIPVPVLLPDQSEQALSLFADLSYTDGFLDVDSGFTHSTLGISTTFEWQDISFTPFFNYQFSFEDDVNHEDEVLVGATASFAFGLF